MNNGNPIPAPTQPRHTIYDHFPQASPEAVREILGPVVDSVVYGLELQVYRPGDYGDDEPGPTTDQHSVVHVVGLIDTANDDAFVAPPQWQATRLSCFASAVVVVTAEDEDTGLTRAWLEPAAIDITHRPGRMILHRTFGGNLAGSSDPRFTEVMSKHLGYPMPAAVLAVRDSTE
jgi:hypothetical protein